LQEFINKWFHYSYLCFTFLSVW